MSESGSTKGAAKEQAGQVAQGAQERGQQVAGTAKEQASHVKDEAASQAKDLLGEARSQLGQHAGDQQQRAASTLRSLSSELNEMAEGSSQNGMAADLARRAGQHTDSVAKWLENSDGTSLLADVRSFASRRPGTFLAMAAGAGVLAGRLTRGLKDAHSDDSGSSSTGGRHSAGTTPVSSGAPSTAGTYPVGTVGTAEPVGTDPLAGQSAPISGDPVYGTEGTQQRGGTSL